MRWAERRREYGRHFRGQRRLRRGYIFLGASPRKGRPRLVGLLFMAYACLSLRWRMHLCLNFCLGNVHVNISFLHHRVTKFTVVRLLDQRCVVGMWLRPAISLCSNRIPHTFLKLPHSMAQAGRPLVRFQCNVISIANMRKGQRGHPVIGKGHGDLI